MQLESRSELRAGVGDMLTVGGARRRPASGGLTRVGTDDGQDSVPGVSELRSMCTNARKLLALCELLGIEGDDPDRELQERVREHHPELELELPHPDGAFILPPE